MRKIAAFAVTIAVLAVAVWFLGRGGPERGSDQAAAPSNTLDVEESVHGQASLAAEGSEAPAQPAARAAVEDVAQAGSPAALEGYGLAGRVVDASGAPVVDATVARGGFGDAFFFSDAAGRDGAGRVEVSTDEGGSFLLPVDEDGGVSLVVEAAGYAPYRREVTGYYERRTDVGELTLEAGVLLFGRVLDAAGVPVPGAEVHAESVSDAEAGWLSFAAEGRLAAVSAPDGSFLVNRHGVGPWSLRASAPGHPEGRAEGETTRAGERVEGIELRLPAGGRIAGSVLGIPASETGRLHVRVEEDGGSEEDSIFPMGPSRSSSSAPVAADGSFELTGLRLDRGYELTLVDTPEAWTWRVLSEELEARAGDTAVRVEYAAGTSLSFRVVDGATGLAVEELRVLGGAMVPMPIRRTGNRTDRFEDGLVRIDGIRMGGFLGASGGYEVTVVAEGYASWGRTVALEAGQQLDLGVVSLVPVPSVRVTVRDAAGEPVPGALVTLTPAPSSGEGAMIRSSHAVSFGSGATSIHDSGAPGREGRTGEDGVAVITSLPGERVVVMVEARRYAPFTGREVLLPVTTDQEMEVRLFEGAAVEVLVVDAGGAPVPDVRVERERRVVGAAAEDLLIPGGMSAESLRTDSAGRAWFRDLAPGVHGFRLADDAEAVFHGGGGASFMMRSDAERPFQEVELADGATQALTISIEPRGSLDGYVTERGVPLPGAELRLSAVAGEDPFGMGSGGGPRAESDEDGFYSFAGVQSAEYELVVEHDDRALPARFAVVVPEVGARFDVDLDLTVVRGRVTDQDGEPLVGARVLAKEAAGPEGSSAVMVSATSGPGGHFASFFGGARGGDPVETDMGGAFELRGIPVGLRVQVRAHAEGFSPATSEAFELAADEERSGVDLTLTPGGTILVVVRDAVGEPSPSSIVFLSEGDMLEGASPEINMTNDEGHARFEDLRPGTWSLRVQSLAGMAGGGLPEPRQVELAPGEELEFVWDLP